MTESPKTRRKPLRWIFHGTRGTAHPTDLVLLKDFHYVVIRRAWLWAFALLIGMGSFGLYGLEQNFHNDAVRSYHQDIATCVSSNDSRNVLLDLVQQSTTAALAVKEDPSFPPALNALIAKNKSEASVLEARAEKNLSPRDCFALYHKP